MPITNFVFWPHCDSLNIIYEFGKHDLPHLKISLKKKKVYAEIPAIFHIHFGKGLNYICAKFYLVLLSCS